MLPTIVFFFALLLSINSILNIVSNVFNKRSSNFGDLIQIVGSCLLWAWLFYLLH